MLLDWLVTDEEATHTKLLSQYQALEEEYASALSLTLPTCFREFHRACPARDVPG